MQLDGLDARVRGLVTIYEVALAAKKAGRIDEALTGYRSVLKRSGKIRGPDRFAMASAALQQISDLAEGKLSDREWQAAKATAAATGDGEEPGWVVRFALGRATANDDPEIAMRWYDAANAMRRAAITYNADLMDGVFDEMARIIDGEMIQRLGATGGRSPKPIFIVGMPRSGTTLVEQILASVRGIHGAGELTVMADLCRNIQKVEGRWPGGCVDLTPARVTQLSAAYLVQLHKLAPKAERVIDKMPANAQNVGLIMVLFPKATILHIRRDPLDNCFGIYRQLFGGSVDYAYDQVELGRYHQGLMRLMDFWKAEAPGRIVDINYPDLVQNFEEEARRIVAATGMPWSDACLEFHKTERQIDTASAAQARQPLFTTGLGSAERFRPYLEPLAGVLAA